MEYCLLDAARTPVEGGATGKNAPVVVLAEGVAPGRSAGGELLLFRRGEPRGRTVAQALAAGWARADEKAPRRERKPRRRNWSLSPAQSEALGRLFVQAQRPGGMEP